MNDNIDQTLAQRRELHRIITEHARRGEPSWSRCETVAICALVAARAVVLAAAYVERVL